MSVVLPDLLAPLALLLISPQIYQLFLYAVYNMSREYPMLDTGISREWWPLKSAIVYNIPPDIQVSPAC